MIENPNPIPRWRTLDGDGAQRLAGMLAGAGGVISWLVNPLLGLGFLAAGMLLFIASRRARRRRR
jgi:hypothetical protein